VYSLSTDSITTFLFLALSFQFMVFWVVVAYSQFGGNVSEEHTASLQQLGVGKPAFFRQ